MHRVTAARSRRTRVWVGVIATSTALAASACTSSGQPSSTVPPTSAPTTTPTAAQPPPINPLTGLASSKNKVIAVKVDDTGAARPQVGLNEADIVYIEQVEGGLTRLVAVFNTHLPTRVGPVRSTRNDDPQILAQYGPIIYVASGGDRVEYRPMDRSNLHAVINDRGGPGFSRAANRTAPLNLFVNLATVAKKVKGGAKNTDIGLHWSARITNVTQTGHEVRTSVGATPILFRWKHAAHRYVRYVNGHVDKLSDGSPVSTPNVIVQFVRGHVFRADIDPAGNPAWYQHTVGSGRVVVFRNGWRIAGHWTRSRAADGTDLVDRHGKPITLAPGGAWFVLVNKGTPLAP